MSRFTGDIGREEEDGLGWEGLVPTKEERQEAALRNRKLPCTCTGSCRGPQGLGVGWACCLTLPYGDERGIK